MNYYFITGTSRGIGLALAQQLLAEPGNRVIGLSRHNTITHPGFRFVNIDLGDTDAVSGFRFENLPDAGSVSLINNAGVIGDIRHAGEIDNAAIINTFKVNLVAPSILTNNFIQAYKKSTFSKTVLNIGSGAAVNAIDGWSSYCSSKAGLDMFSRVVAKEQQLDGNGVRIFSVYPGVVDTEMQAVIRGADEKDFSRVKDFLGYRDNKELLDPEVVARKIISIVFDQKRNMETVFALRDVSE